MAHIDQTYWRNAVGTAVADAIATGSALTQWIAAATAVVDTALKNSGYDSPSTANDTIKLATLGAMLEMAPAARKGVEVRAGLAEISKAIWRGIADGSVMPAGMTPTAQDGVGGAVFSDQTTTSTTGQPPIMLNLRRVW